MEILERILAGSKGISKPRRKFLLTLFTTILMARGKINFRNLSRYSDLSEKTYSRHFAKPFDFVAVNRRLFICDYHYATIFRLDFSFLQAGTSLVLH